MSTTTKEIKEKICPHFDKRSLCQNHRSDEKWAAACPKLEHGQVPTKKVECPECGRRVKQRISFCHDGCCVIYSMPRHKRKGWQKKPKTGSKDKRMTKRSAGR